MNTVRLTPVEVGTVPYKCGTRLNRTKRSHNVLYLAGDGAVRDKETGYFTIYQRRSPDVIFWQESRMAGALISGYPQV